MRAMVLRRTGAPLVLEDRREPEPGPGEVRLRVEACALARTDLLVIDGVVPGPRLPLVPGHQIVGVVDALGAGVQDFGIGARVGVSWLGGGCGACAACGAGLPNLCDGAVFTGHSRDGGLAEHMVADARFVLALDGFGDPVATAPLLSAGLLGWRAMGAIGEAAVVGLFGFGAIGQVVAQLCACDGRRVLAFTLPGDAGAQAHARRLGADWAGGSDEVPPARLDAAILSAPDGALVPAALSLVRPGGRVVCAAQHMSDLPALPFRRLGRERELLSVGMPPPADAQCFLEAALRSRVRLRTLPYPLAEANRALGDIRDGRVRETPVLVV